jgi:MYXO-CTERM domain-containing protein
MRLPLLLAIAHGAALSALTASLPAPAAAYCRTTTEDPDPRSPPDACPDGGVPLYWPTRALSYAINQRGFPDLNEAEVRSIFDASFCAWSEVRCEGELLDLSIEQGEPTTELEPKDLEPRPNVIAHIAAGAWADDEHAFAITNLRFNTRTGHILGADMLFNGGKDPFLVCPEEGCDEGEPGTDLPNVVTHEAGHFLGLAHSDEPNSTMWYDANASDTDKRSLEADDEAGICAIYGPDAVAGPPPSEEEGAPGSSCRIASAPGGPGGSPGLGWGLFGLAGWGLTRRRR